MSASLSVTAVGPTKTAEPLEVPRGMDLVGREPFIRWGPRFSPAGDEPF